jgi:hypothetical protein
MFIVQATDRGYLDYGPDPPTCLGLEAVSGHFDMLGPLYTADKTSLILQHAVISNLNFMGM